MATRQYRKFTDEELIELLSRGWSLKQIAEFLNVSLSAVSRRNKRLKEKIAKQKKAATAKLRKTRKAKKATKSKVTKDQDAIQKAKEEVQKITAEVVSTGRIDSLDVRSVFERLMNSLNNSLDFLEESEVVATDIERPQILKQKLAVLGETRQLVGTIANLYQTIMFQKEYESFCENVYEALKNELSENDRERVIKGLQRRAINLGVG